MRTLSMKLAPTLYSGLRPSRDEEKAAIRRNTQKRARVAAYAEAVVEIRILGVDEPLGVGSDIDVAPPHQPRATADDSGT